MDIKMEITQRIQQYVRDYQDNDHITSQWGVPLVGFADAHHPEMMALKHLISPAHVMPWDILADATLVIAYFVPFTRELAQTNVRSGTLSSPEWARTYEETNTMFEQLNHYLIEILTAQGYHAGISQEAATFDREKLISYWSQRHIARLAGLGTFGVNNMLITRVGCCGRYSTVVTNLDAAPDTPMREERCLYKRRGTCGICVTHCPSGALTLEGYDRKKCFQVCLQNAAVHNTFGSSYTKEDGTGTNSSGSEVCGKCVVNVPCAFSGLEPVRVKRTGNCIDEP